MQTCGTKGDCWPLEMLSPQQSCWPRHVEGQHLIGLYFGVRNKSSIEEVNIELTVPGGWALEGLNSSKRGSSGLPLLCLGLACLPPGCNISTSSSSRSGFGSSGMVNISSGLRNRWMIAM